MKAIPELFVSKEEKEYSDTMGEIVQIAGQLTEANLHTLASKARRILNKQKLSGTQAVSTGATRASDAN
ncbi:hypothetical protein H632_c5135p0 [Helicosporidium sp. ATCC 50920]|nr:hypothetical protein H632_c5135p0 [Helicosporidium sp. ATCC 50920]|eukprot:KDD71390.1 hypothetical protein H632_c5135p0 [Helicosporidium sp. ATCC 50920]